MECLAQEHTVQQGQSCAADSVLWGLCLLPCVEHRSSVFAHFTSLHFTSLHFTSLTIQFILAHQGLRIFLQSSSLYSPSTFSGNLTNSPIVNGTERQNPSNAGPADLSNTTAYSLFQQQIIHGPWARTVFMPFTHIWQHLPAEPPFLHLRTGNHDGALARLSLKGLKSSWCDAWHVACFQ